MPQLPVDHQAIWQRVVSDLETNGLQPREQAFLRLTRLLGLLDSNALLAVPYPHTKEMLETTLRQPIEHSLSRELGHDIRLAITVDEDLRQAVDDESDDAAKLSPI